MYSHPHLIIIAVGRSGSTILQSILNTAPHTLIRGENNNFFYWLFKSYQSLLPIGPRPPGASAAKPWFGFQNFNPRLYIQHLRSIAQDFLLGNQKSDEIYVCGFKEIRFFDVPNNEMHDYLDFLSLLFPGVIFLLLKRNPDEIVCSSWWAKMDSTTLVSRIDEFYTTVLASSRNNLVSIDYSRIRDQDTAYLEGHLFRAVDLPFRKADVLERLAQKLNHCQ